MQAAALGFFRMQAPAGQGSPWLPLALQLVGIFAIVYFLFVRPHKKEQQRHQTMVSELKKGDDVATSGGIIGTIVKVEKDQLILQTGDARITVERHRVARLVSNVPNEND